MKEYDIHEIIKLYNELGSYVNVARTLHVSATSVRKVLVENGIKIGKYKEQSAMLRILRMIQRICRIIFKRKRKPHRDAEVVKLYCSGMTCNQIGKRMGISRERVRQIIEKENPGKRLLPIEYPHKLDQLGYTPVIIEKLLKNTPITELSESIGVCATSIYRYIKRYDIKYKYMHRISSKYTPEDIRSLYSKHGCGRKVARIVGCTINNLYKYMERHSIPRNKGRLGGRYFKIKICRESMIDMLRTMSVAQVAKELGVSTVCVYHYLKRNNLPTPRRTSNG